MADAEDAAATAQAIVDNADRLGLTWNLRNATVQQTATPPDPVPAIYDNDSTIIGMTSMIGPVFADMRVWVLEVPPSGNYIVGIVNVGHRGVFETGPYFTGGLTVATSTGSEVAIPSANWTSEAYVRFRLGRITALDINLPYFMNGAASALSIVRCRVGAQTITGQVLGEWRMTIPSGTGGQVVGPHRLITYVKAPTKDVITKLSLTNVMGIGSTNTGLYGDTTYPLTITPVDVCAINDSAQLRAIARTV